MNKSHSDAADKGVPLVICLKYRSVKAENEWQSKGPNLSGW